MPALPAPERRLSLFILLAFLALIVVPYLIAPLILPQNSVWGGLLGSADDQNVHLMWARQARDGAFFFRDLFTTESLKSGQNPLFFNLLPLLVGWLSRLSGLDVAFPYHALRVALSAWALWQFHLLSLAFTSREDKWSRARILSLALLAFTTGAGFLASLPIGGVFFIDRPDQNFPLMPEAYFLLSAFAYPLNIASFGLLALVFRCFIEKKAAAMAFFAALSLGNIHTYDALPLIATAAFWALWQWKNRDFAAAKIALISIFGALLPVIYQFLVFQGSEEFRIKALTPTAAPNLASMLLGFAPLLVLAALGIKKWRDFPAAKLLLLWIVVTFALIYAPVSFARKMTEGVQIPLVLLAAIGLNELVSRLCNASARRMIAALVLGVLALSPGQFFGWIWNNTLENNLSRATKVFMPALALSSGDAGALRAINQQKEVGAVLCLPMLGSYVPRATGKFTYAGHWAETLNMEKQKFPRVVRFYSGQMSADEARAFLRDNGIRWIVEGQFERGIRSDFSMATDLGLQPIFSGGDAENGLTRVFAVP
ncbi:MAG TPA: hypothetical protein VF627_01445 [Abditibacterium sp.]|jgi:hypothetical protein